MKEQMKPLPRVTQETIDELTMISAEESVLTMELEQPELSAFVGQLVDDQDCAFIAMANTVYTLLKLQLAKGE